jgi:tRNA uridine 5-carbamoylmethylation protein Kti12
MAKHETKHKSKYTKPKNFEASQKIAARKDLKDYTGDEAHGMVPGLVKGIQELVPRNINGEVIDDIENMVPKIKERLYKKVEEGDYSPEHARKVFEKLQIEDTEGYLEAMEKGVYKIKESISKLTESQKEKLVRMYIRNKIVKVLKEQGEIDIPKPPADTEEAPAADAAGTTPPAETDVETPTETDVETPTDNSTPEQQEKSPEDKQQEKEQVLLDKIKNAPIHMTDVLNYYHGARKDLDMVKVGLKPLLTTMNDIENKSEYNAIMSLINNELKQSRKEYQQQLLQKSKSSI